MTGVSTPPLWAGGRVGFAAGAVGFADPSVRPACPAPGWVGVTAGGAAVTDRCRACRRGTAPDARQRPRPAGEREKVGEARRVRFVLPNLGIIPPAR